jgi:ABC-type multidrug transport system permease subunit
MKKIGVIVWKNIQVITRNKIAFFVVFFAPLVLILLLGIAFNNTGLSGISVGLYSEGQSEVLDKFVEGISYSDYNVINYDSESDCITSVKQFQNHLCIVFILENTDKPSFTYHVDYSNIKLVWILIDIFTDNTDKQSKDIASNMITSLLSNIKESIDQIEDNSDKFSQMNVQINEVKNSLNLIDSQMPEWNTIDTSKINDAQSELSLIKEDLEAKRSDFQKNSGDFESEIQGQENDIDAYLVQIRGTINDTNELKISLESSYEYFECQLYENNDLSPYLEDEDMFLGELDNSDNPTCSILFTSIEELNKDIKELYKIEKNLGQSKNDICRIKSDYNRFEDDIDEMYEDSINSINKQHDDLNIFEDELVTETNSAEEKKEDLIVQLQSIMQSLEKSQEDISQFNESLSSMESKFSTIAYNDPEDITNPFSINVKPISSEHTTLFYLFPSLIIMLVCYISLIITSVLEVKENSSPALQRNEIAPINKLTFTVSTYITALVVILIEISIILIISRIFFDIPIRRLGTVWIILSMSCVIFSSIGIIIANILKNEESVILTSIIVACILFLFSNAIIPIENMAQSIAGFAKISPYFISETMLRRTMIFDTSIVLLGNEIFKLFVELCILVCLAMIVKKQFFKKR